jgi:hypothetical protein
MNSFNNGINSFAPAAKATPPVMFPVIRDFPWSYRNDSCLAFCYPRSGTPFVIKGELAQVHAYLSLNGQPILVHYQIYTNKGFVKTNRHEVRVYGLKSNISVRISGPMRKNPISGIRTPHQRCWIIVMNNSIVAWYKGVRAIPRRWVKDFNPYVLLNKNFNVNTFNDTPIPPMPIPKKELTPEEKAEAEEIAKGRMAVASLLKKIGEIPATGVEEGMEVFEIKE